MRSPLRTALIIPAACVAFLACLLPALAQFGQNKVNSGEQTWYTYEAPHLDVYYNFENPALLRQVVSEAESALLEIGKRLGHDLGQRVPMVLYETHGQFLRTNISLYELPDQVGAFAEPFQFRLVLPADSPPEERYKLIRHEMTHIYQYDILYAGSLKRTLQSRPPLWFMEGMASYVADDENSFDQMAIRDAVVNNLMPSVRMLNVQHYMTYRYGHAVFDFIEETWGSQGLQNLIFEVRKALLAQNVDKAFRDAFGVDIETFDRRFARYLRKKYLPVLTGKRSPDEYGPEIGLHRRGRFTFGPTLSPSGDLVAVLATPGQELDVLILSAKDGEKIRNLTRGFTNEYRTVVAGAFEGKRDLSWSPGGDIVAFFVTKENYRMLMLFDPVSGKKIEAIPFRNIAAVASPSFSPDGEWIAFSGNIGGQWDIFRYNMATGETENLTDDAYYDTNPTWSIDGKQVIYNRRIGAFDKIFVVEIGSPQRKTQLTAGASSDIQPTFSRDGKYVYFSSDRGLYGVYNLHRLELATAEIRRLTDVTAGAFTPVEMESDGERAVQLVYSAFFDGTYRLFRMKADGEEVKHAIAAGTEEPQSSPMAASRRKARDEARQRARAGDDEGARDVESRAEQADVGQGEEDADADLEPFRPPLELTLDEERLGVYKTKWQFESPGLSFGVTDDGRLLANASLIFSDVLGDQRIFVNGYSRGGFTTYNLMYLNQKQRINWGVQFQDARDYYLTSDFTGTSGGFDDVVERATRYTMLLAFARYPFSRHYRIEGQAGYAQRRINYPFYDRETQNPLALQFASFSDDYPIAGLDFVGDTTRLRSFGPYQGHRFRVGATGYWFTRGDSKGEQISNLHLDYRGYQHLTANSLLAIRLVGIFQNGDRANIYPLGGLDQLRGFRYQEFVGESLAYANFELRFPLINTLVWGFGGRMGPIRGFLFADIGSAWFEDEIYPVDPTDPLTAFARGRAVYDRRTGIMRAYESEKDGLWQDLHGAIGAGFRVNILGLPATWAFASRYDGKEFGPWHSSFYIVYGW